MWPDVVLVLAAYLLGAAPHIAWLAGLRRVSLAGDFHEGLWSRAGKALAAFSRPRLAQSLPRIAKYCKNAYNCSRNIFIGIGEVNHAGRNWSKDNRGASG